MKRVIHTTAAGLLACCMLTPWAWGWEMFPVSPAGNTQSRPSVSGDIVVWQEFLGDYWDIYGVDLADDPEGLIAVVAFDDADQTRPSIWGSQVAWEDNFEGFLDIWVSDISDTDNIVRYPLPLFDTDQAFPRIHGNTVVWQDLFVDPDTGQSDWDIYAADITDPNAVIYPVAVYEGDQKRPDVYRSRIVWQDDFADVEDILAADLWRRNDPEVSLVSAVDTPQTFPATDGRYVIWQEDFDEEVVGLYGADVSDPANPVEFFIAEAYGQEVNPRLSGHLVIWQDNRSGFWDIYGHNLITGLTFQITGDEFNQTRPDIDGRLVVFEDDMDEVGTIYAIELDGPEVADCPTPVPGDVTGNCRVGLEDLAILAANWLVDGLSE